MEMNVICTMNMVETSDKFLKNEKRYDVAKREWSGSRMFSYRNFHLTVKYEHYKTSFLKENLVKLRN
jgi:hypothetical protein